MSSVPSGLDAWLDLNDRVTAPRRISQPAWHHAADVAEQLVTDIANKANDKADTELDSTRVHDGMALDEFLAQK